MCNSMCLMRNARSRLCRGADTGLFCYAGLSHAHTASHALTLGCMAAVLYGAGCAICTPVQRPACMLHCSSRTSCYSKLACMRHPCTATHARRWRLADMLVMCVRAVLL